jgi:hypothetical protein
MEYVLEQYFQIQKSLILRFTIAKSSSFSLPMLAQYEFLDTYIPLTSEALLASTAQEIDELRDEIFRLHRSLVMDSMIPASGTLG